MILIDRLAVHLSFSRWPVSQPLIEELVDSNSGRAAEVLSRVLMDKKHDEMTRVAILTSIYVTEPVTPGRDRYACAIAHVLSDKTDELLVRQHTAKSAVSFLDAHLLRDTLMRVVRDDDDDRDVGENAFASLGGNFRHPLCLECITSLIDDPVLGQSAL